MEKPRAFPKTPNKDAEALQGKNLRSGRAATALHQKSWGTYSLVAMSVELDT